MAKKTAKGTRKAQNNVQRDLVCKEDEQAYGQVTKLLGDNRLEVKCYDGIVRIGVIRGSMRKSVWISQGDTILVGLREFQNDKCDVLTRYTPEETRKLISLGEIMKENETKNDANEEEDCGFNFEDI